MLVLGIESSCDDTGVALYSSTEGLLGHLTHTQTTHHPYGGIVPELASRDHITQILPLIAQLLTNTHHNIQDLDLIAYTAGPGLPGALMVAAAIATGFSWATRLPKVGIHHLEAHLLSVDPLPPLPAIGLLVSGGHTEIILIEQIGQYQVLGETRDDAAGEAFDKAARTLHLGYPGGPAIEKEAQKGSTLTPALPRPLYSEPGYDFSFSGLKTALIRRHAQGDAKIANLAYEFQEAIVDCLSKKVFAAMADYHVQHLIVAGGVSANQRLRTTLATTCHTLGYGLHTAPPHLCTDNGAMIARAACLRHEAGLLHDLDHARFQIHAHWPLSHKT